MSNSNVSRIVGVLVAAIVIGGVIGWIASQKTPHSVQVPNSTRVDQNVASPSDSVISDPAPKNSLPHPPISAVVPAVTNGTDEAEVWEEKLDAILVADGDENKKAEQLLEMMPKLDEEAQTEVAGHIVNLLDDQHFTNVTQYLTNAEVPEAVSSVFMNDLYNRENSLKLPLVLAVARNEKHPLHEEAKDLLELYIEEDHGADWNAWETAMTTWLKDHPDDEK